MSIILMQYPRAVIERMLKRSNMRVSKGAVEEFGVLMEEITADLAAEATTSARHANRKTVLLEDVKKAVKMI
jgi:histone H3/H4